MPCVANAMLIGDRKKFLSVLLTLKTEVDPVTLEPLPTLAPIALEWCESIGSKAKVIYPVYNYLYTVTLYLARKFKFRHL